MQKAPPKLRPMSDLSILAKSFLVSIVALSQGKSKIRVFFLFAFRIVTDFHHYHGIANRIMTFWFSYDHLQEHANSVLRFSEEDFKFLGTLGLKTVL